MLIRYNKFDEYTRDSIRFLESKGHIGYIRYLMIRRLPFNSISSELLSLGLSGADEEKYAVYFESVLHPLLKKYKIASYYKDYIRNKEKTRLDFATTFEKSEAHRKNFCEFIKEIEIDCFFAKEVREFYGNIDNIPLSDKDGEPIITTVRIPDWSEMLNHPKRHTIDGMLVDGKTPNMISDYLDKMYDIQLPSGDISFYAKVFFKTKRRDLEQTIDELQSEKARLQEGLVVIKNTNESEMTIGEKTSAIANIKKKIDELDSQIKRLTSHHSNAAFSEGVLEYAQMREMFADVMKRTHKRFIRLDERDEIQIINPLNTLVSMMARSSDKILSLETAIKETTKKSIVDEMLEVVMPTLDRVEEEERTALEEYKSAYYKDDDYEENDEILGLDGD